MKKKILTIIVCLITSCFSSLAQIDWVRVHPSPSIVSLLLPSGYDSSIVENELVYYSYQASDSQILFASNYQEITMDSLLKLSCEEDSIDFTQIPDSIKSLSTAFKNLMLYSLNDCELITDSTIICQDSTIKARFLEFNYINENEQNHVLCSGFYYSDNVTSALYLIHPATECNNIMQIKETCFSSVLTNE